MFRVHGLSGITPDRFAREVGYPQVFLEDCGLPDEAFLPRVAERQAKRHRLTALKSPIARQHGVRHEESTVGIEEHSECGDGANSTSNGHKAKFVAKHGAPHGRIPQSNEGTDP